MNTFPRVLKVETGWVEESHKYFPADEFLDYRAYNNVPRAWRWIEQFLRMDIYLAIKVKSIADQYDIIWAGSEKVAIPLSFLNVKRPLIAILHNPESRFRMLLMRLFGIQRKWAGIGIVSRGTRRLLQSKLGVDPQRIFQYYSARTDLFLPADDYHNDDGPILSMGVAKRDYKTLIEALSNLPGYQTEIFISSKYGDEYRGREIREVPGWIQFPKRIPEDELVSCYQRAKFVVIPLLPTLHCGAGVTSAFEASASGKAVIATQTGGMNSYVIHGKTGLLVPPHDVYAMREAIRTLWENDDLRRDMGRAGRKFVEENYSIQIVDPQITSFLSELWETQQRKRYNPRI